MLRDNVALWMKMFMNLSNNGRTLVLILSTT